MVGVLITSHGNLCKEILASAEMIAGKQEGVETVSLDEKGIEAYSEKLSSKLEECLLTYDELIMLADITNATPYNNCYKFALEHPEAKVHLLSGFNLSMVVELLVMRSFETNTEDLVNHIVTTGKNSVELTSLNEIANVEDEILL